MFGIQSSNKIVSMKLYVFIFLKDFLGYMGTLCCMEAVKAFI